MTVGVITDTNSLQDLRSRIAEADKGAGVPLDVAYQRWRANALTRQTSQAMSAVEAVFTGGLALAVSIGVALAMRHVIAARSGEQSEHFSVDLTEETPAAESSAPISHVP